MSSAWKKVKNKWVDKYPDIHEVVLQTLHFHSVDINKVQDFLEPDYGSLHEPKLLPDIDLAARRIWRAIDNNEKTLIFTDYDADGLPGVAIIDSFFKQVKYSNYVLKTPDRNLEGFGLKSDHIKQAVDDKIDMIITVDCGSASIEALELAQKSELDVIVTDHHEAPKEIYDLDLVAHINPMRKDSNYPFSGICGATVAFKLVQHMIEFGRTKSVSVITDLPIGFEKWYLDLVAIATVGDMMSLTNENRPLVVYGLKVLNQTRNYGLRALIDNVGLKLGSINAIDIGFKIAPLLNAASRIGKADLALELLTASDPLTANRLAGQLKSLNNERKKMLTQMVKQAHKKISTTSEFKVIAVGDPSWLPGMCGLLASRLTDEYGCPAFVWGRGQGEKIKGSCRSCGRIDVYQLMSEAPGHVFESYGGHIGAGGFVLKTIDTHDLQTDLENTLMKGDYEIESKSSDDLVIEISPDKIGADLYQSLLKLEPTGNGFRSPIFKLKNISATFQSFGKASEHLKLIIPNNLEAIEWRAKPNDYGVDNNTEAIINLEGRLEYDSYKKKPRISINAIDII